MFSLVGVNSKRIKAWWFSTLAILPCLAFGMDVVTGDFQTILNTRADSLTVWTVADNSKIYIFDFPGLAVQGRTFNRATQFTEQAQTNSGYPKVLDNEALGKYMESLRRTQANFAFGHDLLVNELVQFYNLIERDKIVMYPEEIVLRDFLVQQGLIKLWRGFYQAIQPGVVILSIPQRQAKKMDEPPVSELARLAIFTHEFSHGEYYSNPYYAVYCRKFWAESLKDSEREAFINLFKNYNYDVTNGDLVVNEMQAYLMFTPDPNSFNANKLGVTDQALETMRAMFRQGNPPTKLPLH